MTKVKIGGQKYNLEDLPESIRNRIQSELDKVDIKYDEEAETIDKGIKECDENKKVIKTSKIKIKKKVEYKKEEMSLFRKIFGYP